MRQDKERMIQLIRCEICGEQPDPDLYSLSADEWRSVLALAKKHSLSHLAADAALKNGLVTDDALVAECQRCKYYAIMHHVRLSACLQKLRVIFTDGNIPFLPLKGSVIRDSYPEAWMRTSSDIDVLIPGSSFEDAKKLLESDSRFRHVNTTPHDLTFRMTEGIRLELHHSLIESNRIGKAEALLEEIWDYSVNTDQLEYALKDEMFYYYHLAHMAKHIENGGCGIRPFIDLWLLNHRFPANPSRDELLIRGGLKTFADVAVGLSEYWFGDDRHPSESVLLLDRFITEGGSFGTKENTVRIKNAKSHGKAGYLLEKVWMPYQYLCIQYPSLKGKRILQPAYEFRRWMRIIMNGHIDYGLHELRLVNQLSPDIREAELLWEHLGFR